MYLKKIYLTIYSATVCGDVKIFMAKLVVVHVFSNSDFICIWGRFWWQRYWYFLQLKLLIYLKNISLTMLSVFCNYDWICIWGRFRWQRYWYSAIATGPYIIGSLIATQSSEIAHLTCICLSLIIQNIARIANTVQDTLWLSVTNPQCHDFNFSICQENIALISHYRQYRQ